MRERDSQRERNYSTRFRFLFFSFFKTLPSSPSKRETARRRRGLSHSLFLFLSPFPTPKKRQSATREPAAAAQKRALKNISLSHAFSIFLFCFFLRDPAVVVLGREEQRSRSGRGRALAPPFSLFLPFLTPRKCKSLHARVKRRSVELE